MTRSYHRKGPPVFEKRAPLNLLMVSKLPNPCMYQGCAIRGPFRGFCASHYAIAKGLPTPDFVTVYRNKLYNGRTFYRHDFRELSYAEAIEIARNQKDVFICLEEPCHETAR